MSSVQNHDPIRRYEITSVLGQGGFGTVYRATLTGAGGFTKDVAIKLLKDASPPAEVLERFRDEARILGLVRDRAVVHVEPPVKLADRWAVVMEYVDGTSLGRILRSHGALPPEIALEITAEVARALHRLWHQPGPGNTQLHLRHRDLKPSNLQITPDGSVVLLDFGIAKARFDAREARTSTGIMGSEGYIAPERFYGQEGPTTDVFSLGVVLHEMLTGHRPDGSPPPTGPDLPDAARRLALRMCALDAVGRPEPRDVERQCTELLRDVGHHARLRDWAEAVVPAASTLPHDDLVGEVLTEAMTMSQTPAEPITARVPVRVALFAGGTTAVMALAALAGTLTVALITVLVVALSPGSPPTVARPPPEPGAPVAAAPVVAPAPVPPPAPVVPATPAAPQQTPAPPPPPERAPTPVDTPTPEPAPAPVAEVARWPVSFASLPPDATVVVDGRGVGATPLVGLSLTEGSHTVRMTSGDHTLERTFRVDRRAPSRYLWRVETDAWEGSR